MIDFSNFAFLPLDIDIPNIDLDILESHLDEYSVGKIQEKYNLPEIIKTKYAFELCPIYMKYYDNLTNIQESHNNSYRDRFNEKIPSLWLFDFEKKFPDIYQTLLKFPIQFTHIEILRNNNNIFAHVDDWEVGDTFVDPLWGPFWSRTEEEKSKAIDGDIPLGQYKIYLYENEEDRTKSFYMQPDLISEHTFVYGPKKFFACAINRLDYPHGAFKLPTGSGRKIIISMHGRIDRVRHQELLTKSYEKFKDNALIY